MFDIIPMTWKSWSAILKIWTKSRIMNTSNTYFYSMILVNVEVVTQRKKLVCIVVGSTSTTYF